MAKISLRLDEMIDGALLRAELTAPLDRFRGQSPLARSHRGADSNADSTRMARILLIEDNDKLARGLRSNQTMFDTNENFAVMAGSDRCDHARFTSGLGSRRSRNSRSFSIGS